MISEAIRRYGFWSFDAVSGGHVRQYVSDIEKKLQGNSDASSNDLRKLLDHAANTTDFYDKYKDYAGIGDFPVIKKSLVKEKYNQFISSEYRNKSLYKISTSGSTGERFAMLQDKQKRKRVIAELIYFLGQCGFRLGFRNVYAKVWIEEDKKTKVEKLTHNTIMFDCSSLSDDSLNGLYQVLRRGNSVKCLTGYANSLAAIAYYFDKKGYTPDMFDMRIVVSGAERLEPSVKSLLKKVFGCTVVSRYANHENGFLAQQSINGDNFMLNTAHYFFEALRLDADEPAPYEEPARLVLTDLYNYAMPLIRYDTEDIVIMKMSGNTGSEKKILADISGRCDEIIYDTAGNKIHHQAVAVKFFRYEHLLLYQFIQNGLRDFTIKLQGVKGIYEDKDVKETVRKIVGADADVKIEHVEKIPHLSSGKFKRVICNYNTHS
jgi:phenylacetate-CoA ligase